MFRVVGKLIILFLLVYAGVSIWYGRLEKTLLESPVVAMNAENTPAPVEKVEITRQPNDYSVIVERNIFQVATKESEKKEVVVETKPLEPTKLKLSLMGTISGSEKNARAIISDDVKRQQDIYQVGDSIQGGVIKAIERGKVVLNVNNQDEVLTLVDRKGGGPSYQPNPTDFYKEPKGAIGDGQRGAGSVDTAKQQQVGIETPAQRPRTVRPRPVRRSMHLRQKKDNTPPTEVKY